MDDTESSTGYVSYFFSMSQFQYDPSSVSTELATAMMPKNNLDQEYKNWMVQR